MTGLEVRPGGLGIDTLGSYTTLTVLYNPAADTKSQLRMTCKLPLDGVCPCGSEKQFSRCHKKRESIPVAVLNFLPEFMDNSQLDRQICVQLDKAISESASYSSMEAREFTFTIVDMSGLVDVLDNCNVLHCRVRDLVVSRILSGVCRRTVQLTITIF